MVAALQTKILGTDKAGQDSSAQSLSAPKSQELVAAAAKAVAHEDSRIRTLLNTKETVERSSASQHSSSKAPKVGQHAKHAQHVAADRAHERSDRIAFRQAGGAVQPQVRPAQPAQRSLAQQGAPTGLVNKERDKSGALSPPTTKKDPLSAPLTGMASESSKESSSNTAQQRTSERASAAGGGPAASAETAKALSQGPDAAVVKLLDLVGPEATLTLKERLKEVWVNLDNTPSSELDVIARMPANALGLSNTELLTVQSPQGVHFVAFLRNRNDFEVLQTFDRHALLPGDPSKQLLEAAVVAYEQLGVIFKEGAAELEKKVRALPDKTGAEREVLNGVRGQWVSAKRRRKKCSDLIEQLLEEIEAVELQEQREEAEAAVLGEKPSQETTPERIVKPEFERPVLKNEDGE